MSEVADNKCLSCGANVKFNPITQKWDCEYCGSSFELKDFENIQAKEKKVSGKKMDVDEYSCPNCGAKIITDENTVATHCVYCGNTTIMKNRIQDMLEPDKIIPFKSTKEDAIIEFQKNVKKKRFAPKEFHKKENIEKISGIYIPFWLYDAKTNGEIDAEATNIHHWSDSRYDYTETETYSCYRSGNLEVTDLPVDGSSKFEDDIMDSIEPYDYKDFVGFNRSYLSGFLAEKYDLDQNEVYDRAKKRIENTLIGELKKSINGYTTVSVTNSNINIDNGEVEYALLPVWMLNIKYKNKMYTFAMNGQTKKVIGNVPISASKLIMKSSIVFGITFSILIIIGLIGGML